jgi:hypothetical protein
MATYSDRTLNICVKTLNYSLFAAPKISGIGSRVLELCVLKVEFPPRPTPVSLCVSCSKSDARMVSIQIVLYILNG